jgi:sugar lactone lactonase YvrE
MVQEDTSASAEVDRDDNDAPTDIDEEGDDPIDGDTEFILVTSFDAAQENTGKVWVVPKSDEDEAYVLISGLDKPIGVCFDVNNEFLYVVDETQTDTGIIYQYEIDWDSDDDFQIA